MRLLVVEDDALLGHDLVEMLIDSGFNVVGLVRRVKDAMEIICGPGCDAAVLDVNLGRETSEAVATELTARGIPFLALSGYNRLQNPEAFAGAKLLVKPVRFNVLSAELKQMADNFAGKT